MLTLAVVAIAPAILVAVAVASPSAVTPEAPSAQSLLQSALERLDLTLAQFHLYPDYEPPDRYRLPWIDELLLHPASLSDEVTSFAESIERGASTGRISTLTNGMVAPLDPQFRSARDLSTNSRGATRVDGMRSARDVIPMAPREIGDLFEAGEMRVASVLRLAFEGVPAETLRWLREEGPRILEEDPADPEKDLFALEIDRARAQARVDRVLSALRGVRTTEIVRAGELGAGLVDQIEAAARACQETLPRARTSRARSGPAWGRSRPPGSIRDRVDGEVLGWGTTRAGLWVVGGRGSNSYRGRFACLVDLGGDDTYEESDPATTEVEPSAGANDRKATARAPGRVPDPSIRVLIDLEGNDRYSSRSWGAQGGGSFELSFLVDGSGDDVYIASTLSQGAGFCGGGWLVDRAGNDAYRGDSFTQGAAFLGIGLLWDQKGGDTYECALQGQAFGCTAGIGLLLDEEGNDAYGTAARYTDVLRYEDHQVSLSQGFGYGLRPDVSGGVGLLLDLAGNDRYHCDIYGQGASYWYALGALVDRRGHDVYTGFQYAQGAGIHVSLGLLEDQDGQDRFLAKGVSQGCGHDLGCGWLDDQAGDDVYVGYDLCQGAGSANGYGVLLDRSGNDQYASHVAESTQGYGNPRRGTGSLGLHIDGRGTDAYLQGQAAAESTRTASLVGVRLDVPGAEPAGPVWPPDPALSVPERIYSLQELFWMASAGEPKFRAFRERGVADLSKGGEPVLRFLRERLGERDARDRQTVAELFAKLGPASIPSLVDSLRVGSLRARTLAARIFGDLNEPAGAPHLSHALRDPEWQVRTAAAEGLGKTGQGSSEQEDLWVSLVHVAQTDPSAWVRKSALGALASLDLARSRPYLEDALRDPALVVRLAARNYLETLRKQQVRS